jgi:multiple sugar transport system substrate-binding protein
LAALLVAGVCGCRPAPAPQTLTYAYWALAPAEIRLTRALIADFQKSNPGLRVRLMEVTDRYYDKLTTQFATGQPPDVFSCNHGRLGDLAREGVLLDLAPLLDASHGVARGDFAPLARDDFVPVALGYFADLGEAVGKPGLWGLPRDWGPANLLACDLEALEAAGLEVPGRGWTWEEFAQACRALTRRDAFGKVTRYGAAVCLYPYAAAGWLLQGGGRLVDAVGRSALSGSANVATLRFLRKLQAEGAVAPINPGDDDSLELLKRGRVALAFTTAYALAGLRDRASLRWALAPPLRGRARVTGCIPTGLAISRRTSQPSAAFRLLTFMATEGARRAGAQGLCVPAWRPGLADGSFLSGAAYPPGTAAVLRDAAAIARPFPVSPQVPYEQVVTQLRRALEQVFIRGADPAEALMRAQQALNEAAPGR